MCLEDILFPHTVSLSESRVDESVYRTVPAFHVRSEAWD